MSLDTGDNEPALFWSYVIAAVQRVGPGLGADALTRLHSPQAPAIQEVLLRPYLEMALGGFALENGTKGGGQFDGGSLSVAGGQAAR